MNIKIITYGTFDTLHYGHILLLERAKQLGTHLTAAVSTDEFNAIKGKTSRFSYEDRVKMLSAIKYVDEIIPEHHWDQKPDDIKNFNIDIFTMGDDWRGKFDDLSQFCKVHYLSRTPDISSTMIKAKI